MGRPGGTTAKRPLHFIWLCDCSGSMKERGKIQQLNFAIRDAIPHMRRVAAEHVEAQFFVRAMQFSRGASWILEQPTPIEKFSWTDLVPDAVTDMGAAINLVADALEPARMENRGFPPVLVLITDGGVTDTAVFAKALHRLRSQFWGQKAVRIAVAIGQDAEHDAQGPVGGERRAGPEANEHGERHEDGHPALGLRLARVRPRRGDELFFGSRGVGCRRRGHASLRARSLPRALRGPCLREKVT